MLTNWITHTKSHCVLKGNMNIECKLQELADKQTEPVWERRTNKTCSLLKGPKNMFADISLDFFFFFFTSQQSETTCGNSACHVSLRLLTTQVTQGAVSDEGYWYFAEAVLRKKELRWREQQTPQSTGRRVEECEENEELILVSGRNWIIICNYFSTLKSVLLKCHPKKERKFVLLSSYAEGQRVTMFFQYNYVLTSELIFIHFWHQQHLKCSPKRSHCSEHKND